MKLTRTQKIEKGKSLSERLKAAQHLFFTEYQGLKFHDLQALRTRLKAAGARYAVVKNSIVRHALSNAGVAAAEAGMLKGPVGMAVVEGEDPVVAAKTLATFGKEFPKLKIKAGFVERKWMKAPECVALAALGSKNEVLGRLASALYGSVAQAASVLQAPIRDFVLVLKALEDKKKGAAAA
ncbi:MAG: 50S ribosomal protein L10 [Elusimicrobia bacterium]|nr:50S ribosomal protein L10 [Elusimicrobiota bacterium]